VLVEVVEALFFDQMKKQRMIIEHIKSRLSAELGVSVDVKLVEEKSIERSQGKAKRVLDKRQL
jgi:phenylacetate-CoA ligase